MSSTPFGGDRRGDLLELAGERPALLEIEAAGLVCHQQIEDESEQATAEQGVSSARAADAQGDVAAVEVACA